MKLERIQELNRRLTALVADPQPGLSSWCDALGDTMRTLSREWQEETEEVIAIYWDGRAIGIIPPGTSDEEAQQIYQQVCDNINAEDMKRPPYLRQEPIVNHGTLSMLRLQPSKEKSS